MDQKLLKTSWKQRAVVIIIALLMIFSFIASYIAIVLSNNKKSDEPNNLKFMKMVQKMKN